MSGIKGRSGRRKAVSTLVKEALDANEAKLEKHLGKLEAIALNKTASARDRVDAIEYLINRALGAPKATTDLRIGRLITLTGEDYSAMCRLFDRPIEEQQKLVEQYKAEENTNQTPLLVS